MSATIYTYEDCPERVEMTALGEVGPRYLCNCGQCPEPDPTPAQLQAKVDWAWLDSHHWLVSSES